MRHNVTALEENCRTSGASRRHVSCVEGGKLLYRDDDVAGPGSVEMPAGLKNMPQGFAGQFLGVVISSSKFGPILKVYLV